MHSLNDKWTLYFHAKNSSKKYNDNTTNLINILTIEDFWNTINYMPKIDQIFSDGKYVKKLKSTNEIPNALSLFRHNSYPTWEDKTNINGFEWSLRRFKDTNELDSIWKNLTTFVISENFGNSEFINGVRIVDSTIDNRIMFRFEVWISNKKYIQYFEDILRDIFNVKKNVKLLFRDHSTVREN